MCVLFETRSKSSLCPCQLKNLRTELLTYLIQIFGFAAQTVPLPTKYLSIHPRSNTISTSQYVGDTCQANEKGKWMWSDPSPSMLYSTQSIHKFLMCVLFETRSKSSLCLCQLKNLRTELLTYPIQIFGFAAQTVPHPTKYLSIHPQSNTISTSQYVGDTCQANEKGQGHVRPKSSGEQFFTATINTPSPLPHFLYSARPLSSSSFSNPSAAATSSSPVRKSFIASTSSLLYSRWLRISSLHRRRSRLPLPS